MSKQILNIKDLVILTGFSKNFIYKCTHKKLLPFYKPLGKTIFFRLDDVNQFLLQNRQSSIQEMEASLDEKGDEKIRLLESEIDSLLKQGRKKTIAETESEAEQYCKSKKGKL